MKKLFSAAIIALSLMFSVNANAQLQFGVKGGLNVTQMSFNRDVLNSSNRAGFYIGPTVKFTLPIVGLGVDASALYDQRSATVEVADAGEEKLTQKQIILPINLRYTIGLSSVASLYFFAGPQFGFNVDKDNDADWTWKGSNISANLGGGVMLLNHLQANVNYNIGFGKTGEFKASDLGHGRSNGWQIGLAYYF